MRILCAIVTYNEDLRSTRVAASLGRLPQAWRERLQICCVENVGSERCVQARQSNRVPIDLNGVSGVAIATGCNGGLALGYNIALDYLAESACDNVLFLNSDADVSAALLDCLAAEVAARGADAPPCVLAPSLYSGGSKVSPFSKPSFTHPFAIISFLLCPRAVFGPEFRFPHEYWLDGIDLWFSRYLWKRSIEIREVPIALTHRLSVAEEFQRIAGWRYRNVLESEMLFYKNCGAPRWVTWRLLMRAVGRCAKYHRLDLLPELLHAFQYGVRSGPQL
jgi:hypothetical protein